MPDNALNSPDTPRTYAELRRAVEGVFVRGQREIDVAQVMIYWNTGDLKEKVRLRGLDCPEIDTAEGRAAKRFTEQMMAQAKSVVVATTKPDKYDRYLADVFVVAEAGEEIFLNNALLAQGHAVRKDSYAPLDWEGDGRGAPG